MRIALSLALLLVATAASGCLGGEKRTDWAFDVTGLDEAYDGGARGQGVRIAILDTGINLGHPSMDHLDDGKESNGEVIAFRDFLDGAQGKDAAFDDDGHGTHVAGIISARGSSFGDKLVYGGVDLLGAAPSSQLIIARVCTTESCDTGILDDAVRWATTQGADIISMSLGGGELVNVISRLQNAERAQVQESIEDAIRDAIARGILVVAAAGNGGDEEADVAFPASIDDVLAVGAIDSKKHVADFSQGGDGTLNQCRGGSLIGGAGTRCKPDQKPELVAPGVGILSAWTSDTYVRADGTSQATPFVTAAAALLIEKDGAPNNAAGVARLKGILVDTARPLADQDTPHDDRAGYGLLQADAALRALG